MKLSSQKLEREYVAELSLTSMIDVVFLLLVFFIATASFVQTEREMLSSIRFSQVSAGQVNDDLERAAVHVRPTANGVEYRLGKRTATSPMELQVLLLQYYQNAPRDAFVYVHEDVDFEWVAAAMHACYEAGMTGVSYVPISKQ